MKISDKYEVKADELNVIVREKFIPEKGKKSRNTSMEAY